MDLCSALAKMLREFVASSGHSSGLLFQTSTGAQLLQSNTLGDKLHPILKRIKHQKGGFNIFRRFRLTQLEKSECPDALKHSRLVTLQNTCLNAISNFSIIATSGSNGQRISS